MSIYEFLVSVVGDGTFDIPVQRKIIVGDTDIRTDGVLKGTVENGVITFDDPKPRVKVPLCLATIHKLEPDAPDGAMASAIVPGFGLQKKRVVIEDVA